MRHEKKSYQRRIKAAATVCVYQHVLFTGTKDDAASQKVTWRRDQEKKGALQGINNKEFLRRITDKWPVATAAFV